MFLCICICICVFGSHFDNFNGRMNHETRYDTSRTHAYTQATWYIQRRFFFISLVRSLACPFAWFGSLTLGTVKFVILSIWIWCCLLSPNCDSARFLAIWEIARRVYCANKIDVKRIVCLNAAVLYLVSALKTEKKEVNMPPYLIMFINWLVKRHNFMDKANTVHLCAEVWRWQCCQS